MTFGIAPSIDRFTRFPKTVSGKVLNWSPPMMRGLASYSIFMWQQPFLNRGSTAPLSHLPRSLALALLVGLVSYRLVERPMIRLRRRWERVFFGGGGATLQPELSGRGVTRG